jgi:tetratricopeptide (TPR) repeat protein
VVLFGRCDEESVVAFQPFVEAIAHYVDTTPPAQLRAELGAQAADLALLVPGLGRHLPELAGVAGTGAETERYRIFEAVAALFANVGAEAPVVVVLDDLHWADRPTLGLLQHLIRRSGEVPLLILGTYRDTDLVRTHPMAETLADLRRADLVARLPLRGLSADDVLALVTAGNLARPADAELAAALWAETEGSPLFLREILRHLDETGSLTREDTGRWRALRRIDQLGIPEGVKEVIGRRLTRLSEAANIALRTGSVLGREVRLDVLEAVTDLGTDQLLDALDEAAAAGVVDEQPGAVGRWSFTHALVRQALYEELSLTRRVRLHQRVGEALEVLEPGDGPQLAELAYHFCQAAVAGGADRAIDYARRAGQYALTLAAYEEAARHFAMAVEVADDANAHTGLRADLLLAQGDAEMRVGDARVARATFERVVALVGTSDPEQLARAACGYAGGASRPIWVEMFFVNERVIALLESALGALPEGDSDLRARLLACLAQELYFLPGTEERREELSATAVAMARRLDEPATLAYVLSTRNLAVFGPEKASELRTNSSEIVDLAQALGDRQMEAHALRTRFSGYCQLDEMPAAYADFCQWQELADQLKDPIAAVVDRWLRGTMAMLEGRFDDAETLITEGFHLGQETRDRNSFGAFAMTMSELRHLQGRVAELLNPIIAAKELYPLGKNWADAVLAGTFADLGMRAEARACLDRIDPADPMVLPLNLTWLMAMGMLARACYRLDDRAKAEVVYRLLAPFADLSGLASAMMTGSMHLPLAMTAATAGRLADAEAHFEAALVANTANGWRPWVAQTQAHYARLLLERSGAGDRARARQLIDEAVGTTAELGMAALSREAEEIQGRLLGRIDGGSPSGEERQRRAVTRRDRARARLTATGRAAVARWTRGDTDDDLVRRFGSDRAQRALFAAMTRSFQPAMAFGFNGDVVIELLPPADEVDPAAADWWTIEVRGRKAAARRGRSEQAAVTVHVGLADFIRLASGEVHPVRALVESTLHVNGDVMLAARIPDRFGAVEPLEGLAQQIAT